MFEELLREVPEVQGVARLVTRPSFCAPQFLTIIYTPEAVVVANFVQGMGLWAEFPLAAGGSVSPDVVSQVLPYLSQEVAGFQRLAVSRYEPSGSCPELIGNWARLRAAGEAAVQCRTPVVDGVSFDHVLHDRNGIIRAAWSNPQAEYGFVAQAELLTAYARLQAAARLTPKLIYQAFGVDDSPLPHVEALVLPAKADDGERWPGKKRSKPWRRFRK